MCLAVWIWKRSSIVKASGDRFHYSKTTDGLNPFTVKQSVYPRGGVISFQSALEILEQVFLAFLRFPWTTWELSSSKIMRQPRYLNTLTLLSLVNVVPLIHTRWYQYPSHSFSQKKDVTHQGPHRFVAPQETHSFRINTDMSQLAY